MRHTAQQGSLFSVYERVWSDFLQNLGLRSAFIRWDVLLLVYRLMYQRSWSSESFFIMSLNLVHAWESLIRWSFEEERGVVVYHWRGFLCRGVHMFSCYDEFVNVTIKIEWAFCYIFDKKKSYRSYTEESAIKFYLDTIWSRYPKGDIIQISGDIW